MKPKNLILIGVAVVCGLVAAFLTAQMTAGASKKNTQVDMVEVPVAAKDIPIGTKLSPKDLETYFVKRNFPKEAVPPNAVMTVEEMTDKRTMRSIHQGESVNVNDVNARTFIDPPAGTMLMTTPISLDQSASGFALPGFKVVVMCSKRSQKKNLDVVFPLFVDVLVLAVDTSPTPPQAGGSGSSSGSGGNQGGGASASGFQEVRMISFAVTPDQSSLLTMAAQGGASLRLGLPPQDEDKKKLVIDGYKNLMPTRDQVLDIFADRWPEDKKADEPTKVETVKVWVPGEAVAAGTQLTQDVLDKKFKTMDYPKAFVQEAAAGDEKDLLDKYAQTDLVPALMVAKAHLGKEAPKKKEDNVLPPTPGQPLVIAAAKVGHDDDAASPKGHTDTTPADPKPKEYVYVAINTPQGRKYQKFEVKEDKNVYVGDVTEDEYQQQQDGKGGTPKKRMQD